MYDNNKNDEEPDLEVHLTVPNNEIESPEDRQMAIERDSIALGVQRYRADRPLPWQRKATDKGESELAPGKTLLKQYVDPVAKALEEFIDATVAGKAVHKSASAKYLVHIDPLQAAYLALRFAVNGASEGQTFLTICRSIGSAIHEHLEMVAMAKDHPGLHRKLLRQLAVSTSAKHRVGVLRHVREKYDLSTLQWSVRERIQIGAKMVELMMAATPLFELQQRTRSKTDRPQYLVFTAETTEWLSKSHARCELLAPLHLPMVVKPRKWRNPYSGGYLTNLMRTGLVKTRNRDFLDELGGVDLSQVMTAVNAVQETPWRISRKVLEVMREEYQHRGGGIAGLPAQSDRPLPARPAGVPENAKPKDLTASQREELTAWKAAAAKVYAENAEAERQRVVLAQKFYVAERFEHEPAIYFPHYLDFRGRIYPLASFLNPQGDDSARGLLEFAEGKPLGEDGGFWLAVHIAGLWGVDKVSFADRVAWVHEHEEQILASALDPHADGAFWTTAEKPWQAIAACFDWLGYSLNGEDHVSHLPIAMDGSCSGLQHYSALLCDEVGGSAVNLIPGATPSDIYTAVARRAQELSDANLGGANDDMARAWQGRFCRKVAKQPTMTLCYSATKFGMKGQIEAALSKLDEDGRYMPDGVENFKAAAYASHIIWQALSEVVVAARDAMGWLKAVSDITVEAGIPIRWTSPIGLPVMQHYCSVGKEEVRVYMGGRKVQLVVQTDGKAISKRRQASGVAPNFVHSLDAAHLMATVNLGIGNGLTHFAMVHDSFGCHAADTTLLNAVLRESFVDQYTQPVFERFRDDIVMQLKAVKPELAERIPPLPPMGNLDLSAIRDSEFFFA